MMKGALGGERVGSYWLNHFLIVQQGSRAECGDMPVSERCLNTYSWNEKVCVRSHSHTTARPGMEPGLPVLCPELISIPQAD